MKTAASPLAEPLVIELPDELETQRFIEIREVASRSRLVTVIEVIGPTNKKPGDGQELYLRKQYDLRQAGVSLVEIDLLRAGDWIVAGPIDRGLEPQVRTLYRVVVRRGWRRLQAEYYAIPLSRPCRRSGFPRGRPIPTYPWISSRCSISVMETAATTTSITADRRSRPCCRCGTLVSELLHTDGASSVPNGS